MCTLEKTVGGKNLQGQHIENEKWYEGLLEGAKPLQGWGLVPAKIQEGKNGQGALSHVLHVLAPR